MKKFDPAQLEVLLEALMHNKPVSKDSDPVLVQLLKNLIEPMSELRADPAFKNILRQRLAEKIKVQSLPWYKKMFYKTPLNLPLSGEALRQVYRPLVLGTLLIAAGGLWWSEILSPQQEIRVVRHPELDSGSSISPPQEPQGTKTITQKDIVDESVVLTPKKYFAKEDGYLERTSERPSLELESGLVRRGETMDFMAAEEAMPVMMKKMAADAPMVQNIASMPPQNFSALKGGEVDDNADFPSYKKYVQSAPKDGAYALDLVRYQIVVRDQAGKGVFHTPVNIRDNHGVSHSVMTDTDGMVYFFPGLHPRYAQKNSSINQINPFCQPQPIMEIMPMSYRREMPLDSMMPPQNCEAYFEGYRFDNGTGRCVFERFSGCDRPRGLFENIQTCEQTCVIKPLAQIDPIDFPTEFTVTVGDQTKKFTEDNKTWSFEIDAVFNDSVTLDLAFIVDTTGSMSDQIRQLKTTIGDITKKIRSTNSVTDIRYGLVVYRDKTDEYVTRIYDFTDSLDDFQKTLNTIQANGGGDYPEDINSALEDSIERLSWLDESVKLSFLVADAPPHMDYDQAYDYLTAIKRATEKGIKIFPLASSGLDNSVGEYIFRQLAIGTNAKYVFITNSRGGTDYHVDEQSYSVAQLDDLIVEIIKGELEGLE